MIGQTISHYRIVEKLGEGGMGVVYKAEDTTLDRTVALKFLADHLLNDEEAKQRFLREAKAAAALDHPNICTVYQIAQAEGKTFLAMAFVQGETLEDRIAKGPLSVKDTLDIGRQIAEGLEAAHEARIVHRDIKPANVLIDPKGRATIMDFGLARLTEASRLTKADTTMGTVAYMSPEQVQGLEVDHRSDIWALGCVLYEMVRGQRPFQGQYDQALAYEIVQQEPEPLTGVRAGVPMELEFIVDKCLAKDAESRYRHADELAGDLKNLQEKMKSGRSTVLTSPRASMQREQPRAPAMAETGEALGWKRGLPWGVALLLGLVAVALAMIHFRESPPERTVRRFSFTPESLFSFYQTRRAAISPDGRWIVYVSGESPPALWLRPIDSEQPRKLEGTESATFGPFWSPDSRFIGFAAGGAGDGRLKKIAVEGGPPIVVCEVVGNVWAGAAWSPDGETILFSSGDSVPVFYEVSAGGGDPQRLDAATDESGASQTFPSFLPPEAASRAVLFALYQSPGIYLKNLETDETVKVAEGAEPVYSRTGHIIYRAGAEGGLWALPFSLRTLQATGETFPIAEDLGGASIADDGTLVAIDILGGRQQLVWRDRQGRKLGEIGRPQGSIRFPALSPDGRQVAVEGSENAPTAGDIWLHNTERAISQRLTLHRSWDSRPAWSPDGSKLAFRSYRDGDSRLFVTPADGSGETQALVGSSGPQQWTAAWAPDGTVLYTISDPKSGWDLWLLSRGAEGEESETKPFLATPSAERSPQISPDGRYVAYSSDESGSNEVYVREFPEGQQRWQVSDRGGLQPRWSGDGEELFYVEGGRLVSVEVSLSPEFQIGKVERLFADTSLDGGFVWDYDVSADGRFVMIEDVVVEGEEQPKPSIRIIQNWYEEFRNREQD